ncbi:undecaprenyl-diphosphate phosphatase [Ferruginibacter sp. SUN106]|uniref:undecaprenyl-diphosphate phosphatase n=1 Tax=Ferruginibacter sp. SUN106 TaxID=2978348 RepID=UPI003D35E9CA
MDTVQSIIIAIVEGLTEFLPISSTAHMKFVNPLLGVSPSPFTDMFEVVIQLAAILAVVVLYWKKFFDFKRISFYIKLIIAVIPALIAGFFLKKHIDVALGNLTFIACVMVAGGIILLFIDKVFKNPTVDSEEKVSNKTAFVIGCGQVLSIIFPGLSRSAATIITGMSQKLTRSAAAEFSFFLAVPTMLAASAKSFLDTYKTNPEVIAKDNLTTLLIGSVVAFIVALLAIKFFIGFLKKYGFKVWGIYRIIVGVIMLALIFSHVIN